MKRSSLVAVSLIVLAAISAPAAPRQSTAKVTEVPGILANAAMSTLPPMTGDQFDPNLLSDDRDAIGAV